MIIGQIIVKLLSRTQKDYFQNLNIRDLSDNRKFWKTVKPYFSKKGLNWNKFPLKEKENLALNKAQLATTINSFFVNITGLELKEDNKINANILEDVLDVFNSHPSIETIRRTVKTNKNFHFSQYWKTWYVKSF